MITKIKSGSKFKGVLDPCFVADLIYLGCKRGIVGWWRAGKTVSGFLRLGVVVLSFHI